MTPQFPESVYPVPIPSLSIKCIGEGLNIALQETAEATVRQATLTGADNAGANVVDLVAEIWAGGERLARQQLTNLRLDRGTIRPPESEKKTTIRMLPFAIDQENP